MDTDKERLYLDEIEGTMRRMRTVLSGLDVNTSHLASSLGRANDVRVCSAWDAQILARDLESCARMLTSRVDKLSNEIQDARKSQVIDQMVEAINQLN